MPACNLCPRACSAERTPMAGDGRCASGSAMRVALASLHMWEEPCISGRTGSGAVFFAGCPLGCVFCQNYRISRGGAGEEYTPGRLAEEMERLEGLGAVTINLVTGTHFIPGIISALQIYRPKAPVVWNSSGYETVGAVDALAPYVDVWLPDYKYGLPAPAGKYSDAPDYPETAMRAILRMRERSPVNTFSPDGIMTAGVLVRHLVLPGNTKNSIAALERLARELPGTPVSLMSQYIPSGDAERFPEINRRVTRREYDKVLDAALGLGIDGFAQELSAAKQDFVPDF